MTYKNNKITRGQVIFMGKNGIPLSAKIDEDGTCQAKGVPYGDYLVALQQLPIASRLATGVESERYGAAPRGTSFVTDTRPEFPLKYLTQADSGLTVPTSKARTAYDIVLTD